MTWYGQKETDKVIAEYFDDDYVGTCVEVGVADGTKGSNTLYFEERGWKTLCIDPIPEHVAQARKIRKLVHECACSSYDIMPEYGQSADFYIFDIGKDNILSSLSGLRPDPKLLVSHGGLINNCYVIPVEVDVLSNILVKYKFPQRIDFVSIDTEGTELDVLKGMYFNEWDYKLLVVENNHDDAYGEQIEEYLNCVGYVKDQRYFVNDFYIRRDDGQV